ncbi:transposable element Tcb2 transposase [Trichonephila clavipes]|nr:transposable element Tcb2 transposase [Trichonephila clavipes]
MDKEINVMKERKVWDLVDHPDNIKILENRWVYTIKYDENNKIVRYKARLVARGNTQLRGESFDEVFQEYKLELSKVKSLKLRCYSDTDFATNRDDRVSMGGFITFIDETPISSRTFKQKSVSLSTMEAEYVSLTEAAKEFIWLKNVIDNKSLNLELSENVMFCDNQAAISFSKSPVENYRTKHIDVRYQFLRNLIYDKIHQKISGDLLRKRIFQENEGSLSDTKYHKCYPFIRFCKITGTNVVGYLNANDLHISSPPTYDVNFKWSACFLQIVVFCVASSVLEKSVHHVIVFIRALKVLTHVDTCCFKLKFYRKDLIDEHKIFGMSSRHHIDDFMRGRIIGKIEEGRKITDVAREFDIAQSVVSRLWKSFKTTGMCVVDGTAQQVANQFLAASGEQISRKTVARRLRGEGLYARRPVVCVPLTRQHRTARLQWCREHHNWTEQNWACVLLSDESRFSLSSDCRRQLIWRESDTAYRPENIQEKDRYPTCSIRVWAGIMINGRTRLHVVANGTMTGQRYIEVLLPHVRLFRGAVGDKFVLMDDNATCHLTLAVQDCLDSEGIQRLVWPARSPDLNPIENVWDALGRQVAGRNYPLTNKNTLIRALTEEWDKLPQQLLDNVVQSMVRRVECCITLHDGHILY